MHYLHIYALPAHLSILCTNIYIIIMFYLHIYALTAYFCTNSRFMYYLHIYAVTSYLSASVASIVYLQWVWVAVQGLMGGGSGELNMILHHWQRHTYKIACRNANRYTQEEVDCVKNDLHGEACSIFFLYWT